VSDRVAPRPARKRHLCNRQGPLVVIPCPRVVEVHMAGAEPAVGDWATIVLPAGLMRLLMNPVAGNAEPLGRGFHPWEPCHMASRHRRRSPPAGTPSRSAPVPGGGVRQGADGFGPLASKLTCWGRRSSRMSAGLRSSETRDVRQREWRLASLGHRPPSTATGIGAIDQVRHWARHLLCGFAGARCQSPAAEGMLRRDRASRVIGLLQRGMRRKLSWHRLHVR